MKNKEINLIEHSEELGLCYFDAWSVHVGVILAALFLFDRVHHRLLGIVTY